MEPKPPKVRKKTLVDIKNINSALSDIKNGLSLRKAAAKYDIKVTTLYDYKKKGVIRNIGANTLLTAEEEKVIVNVILDSMKRSLAISKESILNYVGNIIEDERKRGDKSRQMPYTFKKLFQAGINRPGKSWLKAFMDRNCIVSLVPETISNGRFNLTEKSIRQWFSDLQSYCATNELSEVLLDPTRLFNLNATGAKLAEASGTVLAIKGFGNVLQILPGSDRQTITVLVTIQAAGELAPSNVILPYRPTNLPEYYKEDLLSNGIYGYSPSGCISSEVLFNYMVNIFHPWLNSKNIVRPVLVFTDWCSSRLDFQLLKRLMELNICLYGIPPNASHLMQPLEVSCFAPLHENWSKSDNNSRSECGTMNTTKYNFASLFLPVIVESLTPPIIAEGFRKSGLFPFDPDAPGYPKLLPTFPESSEMEKESEIPMEMFKTKESAISAVLDDNYFPITTTSNGYGTDIKLEEVYVKEEILEAESEEIGLDFQPFSVEKISSTTIDDEKLINVIRKYREVYDDSLYLHHNQARQANIWKVIGNQMGEPETECRERWHTLVDRFREEIKCKVTRSKDLAKRRKLWTFERQMEFMRPFVCKGLQVADPEGMASDTEEQIDDFIDVGPSASLAPPSNCIVGLSADSNSKPLINDEVLQSDIFTSESVTPRPTSEIPSKDHLTKFFEFIEETVRTFPPNLQTDLKAKIFNLVLEAEKSNLNAPAAVSSSEVKHTLNNSPLQSCGGVSSHDLSSDLVTNTRQQFASDNSTHQHQSPSISSNLDFQAADTSSRNQFLTHISSPQSCQDSSINLPSQRPMKKPDDEVEDTVSMNIESDLRLAVSLERLDPSTVLPKIDPERLKMFRASFLNYLKSNRVQEVSLKDWTKYLNGIHIENPFSKGEIDAALRALSDNIFVFDDILYLI